MSILVQLLVAGVTLGLIVYCLFKEFKRLCSSKCYPYGKRIAANRDRVFVAAAVVSVIALPAQAQSALQFNLACSGPNNSEAGFWMRMYVIDLTRNLYWDGRGAPKNIAKVGKDQLQITTWLEEDELVWVNRMTGEYTSQHADSTEFVRGKCRRVPYSGMPNTLY